MFRRKPTEQRATGTIGAQDRLAAVALLERARLKDAPAPAPSRQWKRAQARAALKRLPKSRRQGTR